MSTISGFMSEDHDALDGTLDRARREAGADEARALFSRFADGLRAHIGWEEDILFPAFEERAGLGDSGPTVVMRMEHRRIEELLDALSETFGTSQAEAQLVSLTEVLKMHNHKEENVLYPWMDRSFAASEIEAFLERIETTRDGS